MLDTSRCILIATLLGLCACGSGKPSPENVAGTPEPSTQPESVPEETGEPAAAEPEASTPETMTETSGTEEPVETSPGTKHDSSEFAPLDTQLIAPSPVLSNPPQVEKTILKKPEPVSASFCTYPPLCEEEKYDLMKQTAWKQFTKQVKKCFKKTVAAWDDSEIRGGKMVLGFVITAEGKVTQVEIVEDEIADESLDGCIVDHLQKITLAKPPDDEEIGMKIPIVFARPD